MDNEEFLVPARCYLYLAPKGTTAPTVLGEPETPWRNVGFTAAENMQFVTEPTFADISSAQSDYPTGTLQTGDAARLSVSLQQWNGENIKAVYGGGTITEVTPDTLYKYTPPRLGARTELSALLRVVNGPKEYIWVYPVVSQREGVTVDLNKTSEARLPLALAVIGADGLDPWYFLTSDSSMAPTP